MQLLGWRKPEDECARWLIFKQVNDLKTTTYATNYIFILRVLGALTLMVNLRNNANGCSCGKYGILVVKVYFKSESW